ncbi:putative hemolysin secretion ATP-binding domain protein, partial [Vibrio parahaemolyticus V-223/04]
KYIPDNYI